MLSSDSSIQYDVFISYSHYDQDWVHDRLIPRLKAIGLAVCSDRESFDIGVPVMVNMENAIAHSRHTLLVLTPQWIQSEWTKFESLLTQQEDPSGLFQRTVPVLLQPCDLPRRIKMLQYANLTDQQDEEDQFAKLVDALQGKRRLADTRNDAGEAVEIPFVILAMTLNEATDLFTERIFDNPNVSQAERIPFQQMKQAMQDLGIPHFSSCYQNQREDWRPYVYPHGSIKEIVFKITEQVNQNRYISQTLIPIRPRFVSEQFFDENQTRRRDLWQQLRFIGNCRDAHEI